MKAACHSHIAALAKCTEVAARRECDIAKQTNARRAARRAEGEARFRGEAPEKTSLALRAEL